MIPQGQEVKKEMRVSDTAPGLVQKKGSVNANRRSAIWEKKQ